MGLVFQKQERLIRDYPAETLSWDRAVIMPGDASAQVVAAEVSGDEVNRLFVDLDRMALETEHEGVARLVADIADSVLVLMRRIKHETTDPYMGPLAKGSQLAAIWLEPKDVGGSILNSAMESNKHLYGGASSVLTYLHTFTAGTIDDLIPSQIMTARSGVLHAGMIDATQVPKVNRIRFALDGQPGPAQPLKFNVRKGFGVEQLPFVRFGKPVMVGPRKIQAIDVLPNISGDSRPELLSILIAEASVLTL